MSHRTVRTETGSVSERDAAHCHHFKTVCPSELLNLLVWKPVTWQAARNCDGARQPAGVPK
jgi:hypothetical protein